MSIHTYIRSQIVFALRTFKKQFFWLRRSSKMMTPKLYTSIFCEILPSVLLETCIHCNNDYWVRFNIVLHYIFHNFIPNIFYEIFLQIILRMKVFTMSQRGCYQWHGLLHIRIISPIQNLKFSSTCLHLIVWCAVLNRCGLF